MFKQYEWDGNGRRVRETKPQKQINEINTLRLAQKTMQQWRRINSHSNLARFMTISQTSTVADCRKYNARNQKAFFLIISYKTSSDEWLGDSELRILKSESQRIPFGIASLHTRLVIILIQHWGTRTGEVLQSYPYFANVRTKRTITAIIASYQILTP